MPPTFIIEHLDPELEAWQTLEYQRIASDCAATHRPFFLSGVPAALRTPPHPLAHALPASALPDADVRRLCAGHAAARVCLLDPRAERDLAPEEGGSFDVFVVGGILGDDPPRDRTAELRGLGFVGRRLGAEQMTTDTAVRVAWMVVGEGKRLEEIAYVDRPEIDVSPTKEAGQDPEAAGFGEKVKMPFRYVRGEDGGPVLPEGMVELLRSDADKGILDLL